jgi:endoglycosylceramidase
MATWSATSVGVSPGLTFPTGPNVVYSPHLYAASLTLDNSVAGRPIIPVSFGFEEAQREAALYGAAWWTGEWGWFGDPVTEGPLVDQFAQAEDQHLVGGAWWDWKQACGDPHQIGSPGARPGSIADGLNRYSCPSGRSLGRPPQFVLPLSRAYPRAAPGRLTSLQSDPVSGRLRLRGVTRRAGVVSLWIPGLGASAPPLVSGGAVVLTPVPGGWLASVTVGGGAYAVGVDRR